MADYTHARKAMVETQIATSSVTDPRLLSALRAIPREIFLPEERRALAYSDAHHPLGHGRFLPAPAVFARLVQLAGITENDTVLDYHPATGYSTAIIASLAREVVGLEPDAELASLAGETLAGLGLSNARILAGDSWSPNRSTFDAIVIAGAIERVPEALLTLLAPGGRLVCLVRQGPVGVANVYTNAPDGVVVRSCFNATLPLIARSAEEDVFVF